MRVLYGTDESTYVDFSEAFAGSNIITIPKTAVIRSLLFGAPNNNAGAQQQHVLLTDDFDCSVGIDICMGITVRRDGDGKFNLGLGTYEREAETAYVQSIVGIPANVFKDFLHDTAPPGMFFN